MKSLLLVLAALVAIAALLLWQHPVAVRFFDLVFPGEGLYEPVLISRFDFWAANREDRFSFDCSRGHRDYELALRVPTVGSTALPGRGNPWPDLDGEFRLILKQGVRTIVDKTFDGRAEAVGSSGEPLDRHKDLRLTSFPVSKCGEYSLELSVLRPARGLASIRASAGIVVRVSTEI